VAPSQASQAKTRSCLLSLADGLNWLFCSAPMATSLFLSHNEALVPPYRVLVDTNFINLSLENRIDMVKVMMDTLYAKGTLHTHPSHFHP